MPLLLILALAASTAFAEEPKHSDSSVLDERALVLIARSIAVGWTAEQVSFLAGKPEYIHQFAGGVEVWRYRTDKEFLLVAFRSGRVEQVSRRPIPEKALKATIEQAIDATTGTTNRTTTTPADQTPEQLPCYAEIGKVFNLRLGTHEPEVRDLLSKSGFRIVDSASATAVSGAVNCFKERRGRRSCVIFPVAASSWGLASNDDPFQGFVLSFDRSGKLVAIWHMVFSDNQEAIRHTYTAHAQVFADVFKGPSSKALREYGRLSAWATRYFISSIAHATVVSAEGWSSGGVVADMLMYESEKSPHHQLWIIHALPDAF